MFPIPSPIPPGSTQEGTEGCLVAAFRNGLKTLPSIPSCSLSSAPPPACISDPSRNYTKFKENIATFLFRSSPSPSVTGACLTLMEEPGLTFGWREVCRSLALAHCDGGCAVSEVGGSKALKRMVSPGLCPWPHGWLMLGSPQTSE